MDNIQLDAYSWLMIILIAVVIAVVITQIVVNMINKRKRINEDRAKEALRIQEENRLRAESAELMSSYTD